ncbi:MAG: Na+/H+ antiporter NhaC family protein [Bacteroidota bacterium]|nr:Na+/H+ antiporter NhaC family protein [Bacteroidota bacterium]
MTAFFRFFLLITFIAILFIDSHSQSNGKIERFEISLPPVVLKEIPFKLEITVLNKSGNVVESFSDSVYLQNIFTSEKGKLTPIKQKFQNGKLIVENAAVNYSGVEEIKLQYNEIIVSKPLRSIPGILSILPPLLAIILALLVREVVISLFAGVWLGSVLIFNYDIFGGVLRVVDHFVINSIATTSHVQIIVFSLLFGGMVGVISRNGGSLGIANLVIKFAKTPKRGQIATWALSFLFFFDDYANVLIRGNLMRPITDKLKVSREKLSYIVDAGAATVASVFIISTWIGYEVGLIEQGLKSIGYPEDAYSVFISTIPYRFYPILTLVFVLLVALTNRDFGSMLKAERRARFEAKVLRDGAEPAANLTDLAGNEIDSNKIRWYNGLIPIFSVIVVALGGLYFTGVQALLENGIRDYSIGDIISKSDSYSSLLWASFSGGFIAIILTVFQRILSLKHSVEAWFNGIKSMLLAILILVLAWSIGSVTEELHTANYLVQTLRGAVEPHFLPVLTFLIAAIISFATGTSWGTMAIMMPLVIPLGYNLSVDAGLSAETIQLILHGNISSVLAGAVFGDHCSPISDTTIMSSMASACDHIDHVRTQLPYAIIVAVVGMLVGDIPTAFGLSPYISIAIGIAILVLVLYIFGKKVSEPPI